jgi:hypothetical protein
MIFMVHQLPLPAWPGGFNCWPRLRVVGCAGKRPFHACSVPSFSFVHACPRLPPSHTRPRLRIRLSTYVPYPARRSSRGPAPCRYQMMQAAARCRCRPRSAAVWQTARCRRTPLPGRRTRLLKKPDALLFLVILHILRAFVG